MNGNALRILKAVAKRGEISLTAAIQMAKRRTGDHVDQYPLALLLEDGYLGVTLRHLPPDGAEEMKEFSWATTLHMFSLPMAEGGLTQYLGIKSSGTVDPTQQRVFLKAKGALYLDQYTQKVRDRLWSFTLGFLGGILAAVVSAWVKGQLRLS